MTIKRLNEMAALLRPMPKGATYNLRAQYEAALQAQGWTQDTCTISASEHNKGSKRMRVENGDRVFISFNGITWNWLNVTARKRLLLHSQD